jgi:TolB-like protein
MSFFEELKRRNVFRVGIAYTVATWLLIQVTDTVFPRIGLPDSAVTLVIALLAIGFIPALIFAWAFEMTPEGIKREKEIDRTKSITRVTGHKLDRAIIAVLVLALAYFVFDKFATPGGVSPVADPPAPAVVEAMETPEQQKDIQSVAVLPFTAMSKGEDDGYFADGLTEEILNSLARLPELLVTARTSSFHFKDKNLPIPEIAATLGVDHVVEGSVRRSGDKVRITAQLIRASDGFHLWSDTYDRTLEDVFAVQEDIAENVASTLDVVLNETKRQKMRDARINDIDAFIAYQKAMEAFGQAHATDNPGAHLSDANQWFDRALEIVPELSNALYLRTDLFGHVLLDHAIGGTTYSEAILKNAVNEIQVSLGMAVQSAGSASQRAIVDAERTFLSDDWTGLSSKLNEAFKPGDCTPFNWLPSIAVPYGWAGRAATRERELLRCDPLRALPAIMQSYWLIWDDQAENAITTANENLARQGFHPWLDDARFSARLATGYYRENPEAIDPQPEGSAYGVPREIFVYAAGNDIDTALKVLNEWRIDNPVDDEHMAIIMAITGDREAANSYASKIDARTGGSLALTETIKACMCGAPFDLEATPNYKQRIEEAGFAWPPLSPIKFPAKDW